MYEWKGHKGPKVHATAMEYSPRILSDRPSLLVTEEGNVITLETPFLIVQIRQKPGK